MRHQPDCSLALHVLSENLRHLAAHDQGVAVLGDHVARVGQFGFVPPSLVGMLRTVVEGDLAAPRCAAVM